MSGCHNNLNELVRMTNAGLDQLQVWFSENRLSLNNYNKNLHVFWGIANLLFVFLIR